MDWPSTVQYVELGLGFVLVWKLLSLQLHRVYRYFCVFLLADLSGTVVWIIQKYLRGTPFRFDYRIAWLVQHAVVWAFTLLTVYALLDAILVQLPGILRLSRRVLKISFLVAIMIGLLTAFPEYRAAALSQPLQGPLAHVTAGALVFDRVIATVALLTLLCILLFLLWFPVEMSRNLVTFFSGFVVYFALKACLVLAISLWSNGARDFIHVVSLLTGGMSAALFAYWAIFITKAGERVPAKLSVAPLHSRQEDLLMAQLEAMNTSLLRAVRR